jgi:hypothetical protein
VFEPAFQRAIKTVATDILRRGVGSRLLKTTEYQLILDVGAGTVQKAMVFLENSGAVSIESRGHQGRFVTWCNFRKLWSLSEFGRIRVRLPPPGPNEIWAITDTLRDCFYQLDIPIEFSFERGGLRRISSLLGDNCDITLVSQGSVQVHKDSGDDRLHLVPLGPGSFYAEGSIKVLTRNDENRLMEGGPHDTVRVGIDEESNDHLALTLKEFPPEQGYRLIHCDFRSMPRLIIEHIVDVGIWHFMPFFVPAHLMGISLSPLRRPEAIQERHSRSEAFLVSSADRPEIAMLLQHIDVADIRNRLEKLTAECESPNFFFNRGWIC